MGHSIVALALSLLLILCGFYTTPSLPLLGILAFLLSTSFSFLHKSRRSMGSSEKISPQIELSEKNEEREVVAQACASREEERDANSNCPVGEKELPQDDLQEFSPECSTESISDDESLIEISLPDGNHVEACTESIFQEECKGECIWDFLPESVFEQNGLMELLSEINEEDNMIEIDIARGSIKCSSLGIMA